MRGIRFNITDVTLHADAIHRGGGQIIPTARRGYYAALIKAGPRLQEPYFLAEVQAPQECVSGIYSVLNQRRGIVNGEENVPGTTLKSIKAFLPVAESFGFTKHLRTETSGKAFPQCVFDHWETMGTDPTEEGSKANAIVAKTPKPQNPKTPKPQ